MDEMTDIEGEKARDVHIKADMENPENREFTAIISTFGNVDRENDVIVPGAFAKALNNYATSGKTIPVVWDHQHHDPLAYIGHVVEAAELAPGDPRLPDGLKDLGGLWVKGQMDDDEAATKVHKLMKGRRINEFSFAYSGGTARMTKSADGETVRELVEFDDILEVGPTMRGMNPRTALLTVKAQKANKPRRQDTPTVIETPGANSDDAARLIRLLRLY